MYRNPADTLSFTVRTFLAALCLCLLSGSNLYPFDAADFEEAARGFLEGKELYKREKYNSSPKFYCTTTSIPESYFVEEISRIYYAGFSQMFNNRKWFEGSEPLLFKSNKIKVTVDKVRYIKNANRLYVLFKNKKYGLGNIIFSWPLGTDPTVEHLKEMIYLAFSEYEEDDSFTPFVGNSRSRVLHFIGCNHLPEPHEREFFHSLDEAGMAGYKDGIEGFRLSPLSFSMHDIRPEAVIEEMLSREILALLRSNYEIITRGDTVKWLNRLGWKALENWPNGTRHKGYFFFMVESDDINAFALPVGLIGVNRGLIKVTETESELMSVLAHEIAHVERRHTMRNYYKAMSVAFWTKLTGLIAGAAVGQMTDDPSLGVGIAATAVEFSQLARELVYSGYSRDYEVEADFYSFRLMDKFNDLHSSENLLRKFQYSEDILGVTDYSLDAFALHPAIEERIKFADNAETADFADTLSFDGYDEFGNKVISLKIESQMISNANELKYIFDNSLTGKKELKEIRNIELTVNKIFGTVVTEKEYSSVCELKDIEFVTDNGKEKYDNREDTKIGPFYSTGFTLDSDKKNFLGRVQSIQLEIDGVKEWKRSEKSDI